MYFDQRHLFLNALSKSLDRWEQLGVNRFLLLCEPMHLHWRLARTRLRPVPAWCQPGASLVSAWCQPGASLVPAWCQAGASLVPAWCPPGARLVPAWSQPGASLVPAWCRSTRHCPPLGVPGYPLGIPGVRRCLVNSFRSDAEHRGRMPMLVEAGCLHHFLGAHIFLKK